MAALCDGRLDGDVIVSTELQFRPGGIRGGTYRFDVGTAGSTALVLQAVLPVALRAGGASALTITGAPTCRGRRRSTTCDWCFRRC